MEGQGVAVLTSANVMCFQVRRQSEKWREAGPAVGEVAGHKVSAPDKDTTILRLPHRHESKGSSDIGPIWTERDSAGRGAKQACSSTLPC
jgi:hypothetical protein